MSTPNELHAALDEHLRNFMVSKGLTLKTVAAMPISELMKWSATQAEAPEQRERGVIVIEPGASGVSVRSFGGHSMDPASPVGKLFGAVMDFARART